MNTIKLGDLVWYQDDVWTVCESWYEWHDGTVGLELLHSNKTIRMPARMPDLKLLTPLTEQEAKDPANNGRTVTVLPVEDLSVWQKPLVGKSFLLEIDGSDFPLLNRLDGTPSQTDINGQQSYKEEHDNARYHKLAFIDDKPKEELGIKWDYPLPKGVIKTTHLGNILDFYQPVTNPPAKFKEAWELLRGNAINAMAESCAQAYINSLTKPTIMNKVKETITNLFHTKTDQVLIDHGMENSDGTLTPETQALMLEELAKERWLTKRDEIAKHLIDSSD